MSVHPHGQALPPAASPVTHGARGRWRGRHVLVAVVAVAVVAGVAGVFIGRATEAGHEAGPSLSWQPLPQPPIAGRSGAAAVWTGKEMIVWGGYGRSGNAGQAADGAAYDPAMRAWRAIAPAPAGVQGGAGAGVAWTGDAMVVWASNSPDGPVGAAVYDPVSDTWRRLPAGPLGRRELYSSVWTGTELLVIGGALGDTQATPVAAALNPQSGTWRLVPAFDDLVFFGGPNGAVWDGREVFVAGALSLCPERGSACAERRSILVAYDPAADTVREIALPAPSSAFGADTAASLKPIGWTGTDVVFTAAGNRAAQLIRYNPTIGGWKGRTAAGCHIVDNPTQGHGCRDWRKGPPAPCYEAQTAWLGDRYVASCGEFGLQIFSLATNAWALRTLTQGPSPLSSRGGSAIVWTGTDLIVWSGMVGKPGNPTPADGASLTLPE